MVLYMKKTLISQNDCIKNVELMGNKFVLVHK